jgi:peptidoglycan hydrolase-like protein with peptidoglycan-binding domain
MIIMNKYILSGLTVFAVCISFSSFLDVQAANTVPCAINRAMFVGAVGEDVRCLQRYLNASGFPIASYGAGSPGQENGYFGEQTRQAFLRWQASGQITTPQNNNQQPNTVVNSSQQKTAQADIERALEMVEDADDEISSSEKSEQKQLDEAKDYLLDAARYYFAGNYSRASTLADDAYDTAEEAYEDAGGKKKNNNNNSDRQDALDAINDAEDAIEDAEDEIEEADDDGKDTDDAEDLFEDAQDRLDDAEEAYDDKDYDDAVDFAEDAEELADDAIDEL